MSFGFSIGDIIKALELAKDIRTRLIDAPEQFSAISYEVRSLSIVLDDVKVILPQRGLTTERREHLVGIFEGCFQVLTALRAKLKKYEQLKSDSRGFRSRVIRKWTSLKWEPEDIKELRSRITSNTTLLSAFHGLLIKEGLDRLNEIHNEHAQSDDHQAIIDWLTPLDYGSQQSDFISRRQEGTGEWLLKSPELIKWFSQPKQTLLCLGLPGAGKTMATSMIVDHLWSKHLNDSSVGIGYIYCNFRRQREQKVVDLLASLLKQLVQGRPSIPASLKALYQSHRDKRTRPSMSEISAELHAIATDFENCFIIVDALDECNVAEGVLDHLLSEISQIQAAMGANLFATSRHIPNIQGNFQKSDVLEMRASEDDVRRFIDGQLSRLPRFVSKSNELQEEIKTEVLRNIDGMFLFAQLHLESLIGEMSPKSLRRALKALPKGPSGYDQSYQQAMERVEGQTANAAKVAKRVLSWIVHARRPLTTVELRHALAVELGGSRLDESNLPDIEDMVSVCAGLVIVDKESDIIRLVHYTTQEYFERTGQTWFPDAQQDITETCVTYISFDAFQSGRLESGEEFWKRLLDFPLYEYSAKNWGSHARNTSKGTEQLILNFLANEAKVLSSHQALINAGTESAGTFFRTPTQVQGMHLAAFFGLHSIMKSLIDKRYDPNCSDSERRTPLSYAAEGGQLSVAELLLNNVNVLPSSKDMDGWTPLTWAAAEGHDGVVQILLARQGLDLDPKDHGGDGPLALAALRGHGAVVELLLGAGVNVNGRGIHSNTPLIFAAAEGHFEVVRALLDHNADVDEKGWFEDTALIQAATGGHEQVIKMLLEEGAQVNAQNKDDSSALTRAAYDGYGSLVKTLLENGAYVNVQDRDGHTPLSLAAGNGHGEVINILLEHNADIDIRAEKGQSPLHEAAACGQVNALKILLKRGASVNVRTHVSDTALTLATRNGHEYAVQELLRNGADLHAKTMSGATALDLAQMRKYDKIEELLLEHGALEEVSECSATESVKSDDVIHITTEPIEPIGPAEIDHFPVKSDESVEDEPSRHS